MNSARNLVQVHQLRHLIVRAVRLISALKAVPALPQGFIEREEVRSGRISVRTPHRNHRHDQRNDSNRERRATQNQRRPIANLHFCEVDGGLAGGTLGAEAGDGLRWLVVKPGNPVLVWNASNLVARPDVNQNLAPDKKNSFEKIDGMVALYEATGIMLAGEAPDSGVSVYEQRGLADIAF